MRSNW